VAASSKAVARADDDFMSIDWVKCVVVTDNHSQTLPDFPEIWQYA
jgi:hypothetical protein